MSWIGAKVYKFRTKIKEVIIKSRFRKSIKIYVPVIVYQMGKVGSSSIYTSLKKYYDGIVLHRHVLEKDDWQAQTLLEHSILLKKPLKLISLVREPVGRNISAFFQNFEKITGMKPEASTLSLEEIKNMLLSNPKMDNRVPLWWFDENTLKNFGIDVFGIPFDKKKGWTILKKGNIELLLIKSEISDTIKTEAIKEFIGLKDFTLFSTNVGDKKTYSTLYSVLKNKIKLPEDYLKMLYTSPQIQHFYTEEELDIASRKWK